MPWGCPSARGTQHSCPWQLLGVDVSNEMCPLRRALLSEEPQGAGCVSPGQSGAEQSWEWSTAPRDALCPGEPGVPARAATAPGAGWRPRATGCAEDRLQRGCEARATWTVGLGKVPWYLQALSCSGDTVWHCV